MSAGEFEGHEALVAELRAGTLDAPAHLHRRVLEGGRVKRRRWADMSGRRRAFLVLPAAAALAVGAAVVHGAFFPGSGSSPASHTAVGDSALIAKNRASLQSVLSNPRGTRSIPGGTFQQSQTNHAWSGEKALHSTAAYSPANIAAGDSVGFTLDSNSVAGTPVLSKNRRVHLDASLEVAVANNQALTQATMNATNIVTTLGGYAQHVSQSSRKGEGGATLELRVPVGHAVTAIRKLSRLGHVVSSQYSTQDLQQQISKQTDVIGQLRRAIKIYEQSLLSGTLTGSQRVNVQIALSNAQHELKATLTSRSHAVTYAATANIELQLSTNAHAFAVPAGKTGRLGRLLHNAGNFLALEGVIVLVALIVAGPIVVLLVLAWWLTRERRRRGERRLLASA